MQKIPFRYHLIFWVGLILLSVAILSPYYYNLFKAVMHRLVFIPVWLVASYLNLYLLLPKLWDRGKKILYGLSIVTVILVLTIVQRIICIEYIYPKFFWMQAPNASELNPFWLESFIQFAGFISLPVLLSIGIREGWKWYQESYMAKQVIAEQQEAELKYLKAQVNPHFLFNTLNSLYGLSLESSEKVPHMILKLSNLLSYSLYESKVEFVTINKELELINDFISLEKERYEERVEVDLIIDEGLDLDTSIAPLLLLPLVENAFKHGVKKSVERTPIKIDLSNQGNTFQFRIKNRISQLELVEEEQEGGLGLSNLRRRLELHYPQSHTLLINKNDGMFEVILQIKWND